MDNALLTRYSRHILLPELDYAGQLKLTKSRALIIGAGGLASPVAMYLASSGVGQIVLVDFDKVEVSNLQRQIMHGNADIGRAKVDSAKETLSGLNPETEIITINRRLAEGELREQVKLANIILETTDNFESRFLLNRICVEQRKPLISGSVIRFEGQLSTFRCDLTDSPCYQCLYTETEALEETCSQNGVLAPVVGIIGSLQATEALKVLAGIGTDLAGRLMLFNALNMEWRTLKLKKDPDCPICSAT